MAKLPIRKFRYCDFSSGEVLELYAKTRKGANGVLRRKGVVLENYTLTLNDKAECYKCGHDHTTKRTLTSHHGYSFYEPICDTCENM